MGLRWRPVRHAATSRRSWAAPVTYLRPTLLSTDNARLVACCGLCWSEICANKQLVHQAAMWCVVFWCNSSESRNGAFTIRYSTLSSQAERQREVISNADMWRRMGNLLSSCVGALRMFFSSSPWKETAERKSKLDDAVDTRRKSPHVQPRQRRQRSRRHVQTNGGVAEDLAAREQHIRVIIWSTDQSECCLASIRLIVMEI